MSAVSQPDTNIPRDQLLEIGKVIEQLFPLLPEIPLHQWYRFSFDVAQDSGGVQVCHVRFAKIEPQDK